MVQVHVCIEEDTRDGVWSSAVFRSVYFRTSDSRTFENAICACFDKTKRVVMVPVHFGLESDFVFVMTPNMVKAVHHVPGCMMFVDVPEASTPDLFVRVFIEKKGDTNRIQRLVFSHTPFFNDVPARYFAWKHLPESSHNPIFLSSDQCMEPPPDTCAVLNQSDLAPSTDSFYDALEAGLITDSPAVNEAPSVEDPACTEAQLSSTLANRIHHDLLDSINSATTQIVNNHVARLKRLHSATEQNLAYVGSVGFMDDVIKRVRVSLERQLGRPEQ